MSDYSYYIVHEQPPRPRLRLRTWLRSWFGPITVWTIGSGADFTGSKVARRPWTVHRGSVVNRWIDHTCAEGGSCECLTGRRS